MGFWRNGCETQFLSSGGDVTRSVQTLGDFYGCFFFGRFSLYSGVQHACVRGGITNKINSVYVSVGTFHGMCGRG